MTVGVGVIGVGLMGRRHAENVLRVPGARLVAVADARREAADAAGRDLGAATCTVEALLARDDVHAVIVASPAAHHEEHAVAAARAGKDMLVEKPVASTLEAADRVIAAAREAGVRLQVGFHRRYDPPYLEARRLLQSGALGAPLLYRGVNRDRDAGPCGPRGSWPRSDILVESAIHDLDGARWMLRDEVQAVRASVATVSSDAACPDVALVQLSFAGGVLAEVEALRGARYAYDIRTEIVCERGAILIGSFAQGPLVVLREGDVVPGTFPGFLERYAEAYATEVRDFLDGVIGRRPTGASGADGRRALEIALAADTAAAEGREVLL